MMASYLPSKNASRAITASAESLSDEDKWFNRLQECLENTEFVERLISSRKGQLQSTSERTNTEDDEEADGFVLIKHEDATDEMANLIAACIVQCPEARDLSPVELHHAIIQACKDIKKTKKKSYWGWITFVYRTLSVGYSALQVCTNPWVILAILRVFWTVPRNYILGFFV